MDKIEITHEDTDIAKIYRGYSEDGDAKRWIPDYQREYVWDDKKVINLVDSIVKGYPLGAILIWKEKETGRNYILDGLQRTISLTKFISKPFRYFTEDTLTRLISLSDYHNDEMDLQRAELYIKTSIGKILKSDEMKNFSLINKEGRIKTIITNDDLLPLVKILKKNETEVLKAYSSEYTIEQIAQNILNNVLQFSQKKINLFEIVVRKAEVTDAIEIFTRLNKEGKKLEPFEIYSASWSKYPIDCSEKHNDVYKNISERNKYYFEEIDQNIKFKQEDNSRKVIPSDFMSSIIYLSLVDSVIIKNKIMSNNKIKNTDDIILIFQAIANYWKDANDLGIEVRKKFDSVDSNETILNLKKAIASFERNVTFLKFRGNNSIGNVNHIELQNKLLISGFMQYYKELANGNTISNDLNFEKHIISILATGEFSGSTKQKSEAIIKESKWISKPKETDSLMTEIKMWANSNNSLEFAKSESKSRTFDDLSKILILKLSTSITENNPENFEYDHVVPFSYLKENKIQNGISSIGNINLLDSDTNKSKPDEINDKSIEKYQYDVLARYMSEFEKEEYIKILTNIKDEPNNESFKSLLDFRTGIILKNIKEVY